MRKDAKIGFAIGGVLLAVLTVYVILVPRHRNGSANTVTLAIPPGNSAAINQPPVTQTSTATDAITDKSNAAKPADSVAKSDGVNWAKLLGGAADVPPMMSSNPGPSDDNTAVASAATPEPAPAPVHVDVDPAPAPFVNPAPVADTTPPAMLAISAPSSAARSYTIKSGQTLSTIAAEVYGNQRFYVAIMRANPAINPNRLKTGTKIILPDISDVKPEARPAAARESIANSVASVTATYQVEAGDNLYRISKKLFGTPKQADVIYEMNKTAIGADKGHLKLGMVLKLPNKPTAGATASTR